MMVGTLQVQAKMEKSVVEMETQLVSHDDGIAQLATRSRKVSCWPTFPGNTTYADSR
jgi:hypothetical protein